MSLFGTGTAPAAAAPSGFSTTWNFGAQSTAAPTLQPQSTALGNFGSPFAPGLSTASSIAPTGTVPTLGGFGLQPQLTQQLQPLQQPQTQATVQLQPQPVVGLGGARTDASSTGAQALGAGQNATTPKETVVPPEIAVFVEQLKQRVKENRDMSAEIASTDMKMLDQFDYNYRLAYADYNKALNAVQKTVQAAKVLRAESRQDLLDGEMAHRLRECLPVNFDYAAPLNYLLRLALNYEKQLISYAEELQRLEKLIFGQQRTITADDITAHLKRIDAAFRYVTTQMNELNDKVQELKDSFKEYRRAVYGDAAKFFPSGSASKDILPPKIDHFEGPSPFSSTSNSALLVIANALSRAQAGTGLAPNISLPVHQPFGTQLPLGFGLQSQQQPFGTQSIFRPFGATSIAPTVTTSATPFASGALSFNTGLGATTTTAPPTLTTSTAASPWRFSSPFNTSSSGTLFGGTATNVGAVKPLGLATPLQQGASPATSLQLLNPPLGSKRGKS